MARRNRRKPPSRPAPAQAGGAAPARPAGEAEQRQGASGALAEFLEGVQDDELRRYIDDMQQWLAAEGGGA